MYEFAHQDGRFANWAGVPHAAEVPYVFGVPLFYPEAFSDTSNPLIVGTYPWTQEDRIVSQLMIASWTEFAKFGYVKTKLKKMKKHAETET